MIIKQLIEEDFINYKKPSLFIGFPYCTFKCEKDCGVHCCQNSELSQLPNFDINIHKIVARFTCNDITQAIVCGGLEPFDSFEDLYHLIQELRNETDADIVIYTGYTEEELADKLKIIKFSFNNIIVKFGRYIPNDIKRFDETLGVWLASHNQYALKIS